MDEKQVLEDWESGRKSETQEAALIHELLDKARTQIESQIKSKYQVYYFYFDDHLN
jgi:hypothetical protein